MNSFVVNENFKWKKFPIQYKKFISVFVFDQNTKINNFLNELCLVYPENLKICNNLDFINLDTVKKETTILIDIRKKKLEWHEKEKLNLFIHQNDFHIIVLMDKSSDCKFLFSVSSLVVIDSIDSFNSTYGRNLFNINKECNMFKEDFILIIERDDVDNRYNIRV